eukprot:s1016_g17.t1
MASCGAEFTGADGIGQGADFEWSRTLALQVLDDIVQNPSDPSCGKSAEEGCSLHVEAQEASTVSPVSTDLGKAGARTPRYPGSRLEWLAKLETSRSMAELGIALAWGYKQGFLTELDLRAEPLQPPVRKQRTGELFPLPVLIPEGVQLDGDDQTADERARLSVRCWVALGCAAVNVLYRAPRQGIGRVPGKVAQRSSSTKAWWQVYLDNFLSGEKHDGTSGHFGLGLQELAMRAWDVTGVLSAKDKQVLNSPEVIELGIRFDGKRHLLGASAARVLKTSWLSVHLQRRGPWSQKDAQVVLGRWIFVLQFRRAAMGVLSRCWRATESPWPRPADKNILLKELMVLVCMGPLLQSDMSSSFDGRVTVSDASETGGAAAVSSSLSWSGRSLITSRKDARLQPLEIPVVVISCFNGIGGAFRLYDILGLSPLGRVSVLQMIQDVFRPACLVKFVVENVASMDEEARQTISHYLDVVPVKLDPADILPVSRPRFAWCSEELHSMSGVELWTEKEYVRAYLTSDAVVTTNQWIRPGWNWDDQQGHVKFATFMKAIPRRVPPPFPAGRERATPEMVTMWTEHQYRYPPYQYNPKFWLTHTSQPPRLLDSSERELLLGFGPGHTDPCQSASLKKKSLLQHEDLRCSLCGDSFAIVPFAVMASVLCSAFAPRMTPTQMVERLGLAPGASAHPSVKVPLTRWLSYGPPPEDFVEPTELVKSLGLSVNHTGSDVRVLTGQALGHKSPTHASVRAWRRYESAVSLILPYLEQSGHPDSWDDVISDWVEAQWARGESVNLIADCLSGLHFFVPHLKGCLRQSWRLFKAWRRVETPNRAAPLTVTIAKAMVGRAVELEEIRFASLVALGFHALLRTGELLAIQFCDLEFTTSCGVLTLKSSKSGLRHGAEEAVAIRDSLTLRLLETLFTAKLKKRLGLPPARNIGSKETKAAMKRLDRRMKAIKELRFLWKRGILKRGQKIPAMPDKQVELSESQTVSTMVRARDGLLQLLPRRRAAPKATAEAAPNAQGTVTIGGLGGRAVQAPGSHRRRRRTVMFNREPCDRLIYFLKEFFDPEEPGPEPMYSLAIEEGINGARLSHPHSRQYTFVLQSMTLWREVLDNMFQLWHMAEEDLLDDEQQYQLADTGQGYQRVQKSVRSVVAMQKILADVQRKVGGWVGSSIVHLGDHNVPNALMFIDKYIQVPRFLGPLVLTLDKIPELSRSTAGMKVYIESFGGVRRLQKLILADFFRHAFDGSGADNFFDAGDGHGGRGWSFSWDRTRNTYS